MGKVLRLERNYKGRVFALGDIHGAYDSVITAMRAVNFDTDADLMIDVGDHVDRSPGSERTAKYLDKPYVVGLMGNHDYELVDLYKDGPPDRAVIEALCNMNYNGISWIRDVLEEKMMQIVSRLAQLPYVIELETQRGTVGFVHGDVPKGMRWDSFVAAIEAGDRYVTEVALGLHKDSRRRLQEGDRSGVPGIGRLFVGHTIQWEGVQRFGNVWAIDAGAIQGELGHKEEGHLAMMNVVMKTQVLSARRVPGLSPRIDIKDPDTMPTAPFSEPDVLYADEPAPAPG